MDKPIKINHFIILSILFLSTLLFSTKSSASHAWASYVPSNANDARWTCYASSAGSHYARYYGCPEKHGSKISWYKYYVYKFTKSTYYIPRYGGKSKLITVFKCKARGWRNRTLLFVGNKYYTDWHANYYQCSKSPAPGMALPCPNLGFTYSGKHAFCCNPAHATSSSGSTRKHK